MLIETVEIVDAGATVIGSDLRTSDCSRLMFSSSSAHFSPSECSDSSVEDLVDLPRPESDAEPRPESHSL